MTTSKRLAAFRAACPTDDAPDEDEMTPDATQDGDEDDNQASTTKEKTMSEPNTAALDSARAEGHAAGFAAANARFNAVLASEHYQGRETLAQTLLGNDKLAAEEIITALAAAPKVEPSPIGSEHNEDAARAQLQQNLAAEQAPATPEAPDSLDATAEDNSLAAAMKARFSNAK